MVRVTYCWCLIVGKDYFKDDLGYIGVLSVDVVYHLVQEVVDKGG